MAQSADGEHVLSLNASSTLLTISKETIYSPLILILATVIGFVAYKIVRCSLGTRKPDDGAAQKERRYFTIEELRAYDGTAADGRILIAINGKVFDVTKHRRVYEPGGPCALLAGRDASRSFATYDLEPNDKDEPDDLSDLSPMEVQVLKKREMQFAERYEIVGTLLREGEQPTNDADEEDDVAESVAGVNKNKNIT